MPRLNIFAPGCRFYIYLSLLFCLFSLTANGAALASEPTYTDPLTGMQFIFIKGGTFDMGDIFWDDATSGRATESPVHEVTLGAFYMAKTEVTFAQFDIFCRETKRPLPGDNGWGRGSRPVINVSWNEAVDFALWLGKKTGKKFHLPSESQWEYAARSGTKTRFWWGANPNKDYAAYRDEGDESEGLKSMPVASYPPNLWGLHDMAGNVWEWCMDRFHETYDGAPADGSPWLDVELGTDEKVVRGGAYRDLAFYLVSYIRTNYPETERSNKLGFRLAMAVPTAAASPKK